MRHQPRGTRGQADLIFSHPDDAVRECHRANLLRDGTPSRSIAAHGRHYEWLCPRCHRHKTVEVYNSREKERTLRCAHCMFPRPWKDAYVLGGHTQGGRGGSPPRAMIVNGDLAPVKEILEEMLETPDLTPGFGRIYQAWVESGRSQEEIAYMATQVWVERRGWSENDVRRAVRCCRAWLRRRLEAKRIFRPVAANTRRGACPSESSM